MEDIKRFEFLVPNTSFRVSGVGETLIFDFSYIGEKNTNTTTTCAAELNSENFCEQRS